MTKQEALAMVMKAQMAEEAKGIGDRIPDDASVASWLIIGLCGCVSMLQRMIAAGHKTPEYWIGVVEEAADHLFDWAREARRGS